MTESVAVPLQYSPPGPIPLPSCSGPPGYPRYGTRFYDDRGAAERGYRVMLQGATSSGGCWTGRRQIRASSRVPAMPHCRAMRSFPHLATRPPGQRVSTRRLGCRSQRPTRRAGNAGSAGVPAQSLVRCAESGGRRDGRAAPDHLRGMAGCPGLAVGNGRRPDSLVRVVGLHRDARERGGSACPLTGAREVLIIAMIAGG